MKKLLIALIIGLMACGAVYAADAKITALSADATPTSDDLITTVNDPGGSAANRKVTLANLAANMPEIQTTNLTASGVVYAGGFTGTGAGQTTITDSSASNEVYIADDVNLNDVLTVTDASAFLLGVELGGGVSDGDKGDVVVSSSGAVWTVESASDALTVGGNNVINFTDADVPAEIQVNGNKVMDLSESGVILVGGDSTYISGLELSYTSATSVNISAGSLAVGDVVLSFDASESTVSVFDNGGFTYLYVDGDNPGTPTMYWSATEPTRQSDGTFYNGNDRSIGALYCDSASTIEPFVSQIYCGTILTEYSLRKELATSMNPGFVWQTPSTAEMSTLIPVFAKEAYLRYSATDTSSDCSFFATTSENASVESNINGATAVGVGYNSITGTCWLALGPSRNIRVTGEDNDDNFLNCWVKMWKGTR